MKYKIFLLLGLITSVLTVAGCSTNSATGKQQFTALMSPQQEVQIGAQEHQKIVAQYGIYENSKIQAYVNGIGQRVAKNTENPNVDYKFFVLDSPIVNAFALPGGYVYVSRGLLALANSEAELAAVLGHEIGHVTGRHSAERYSRGALASIGAQIISMSVNTPGAGQIAGLGANLYLSSYSRGQENEADSLGLRYISRANYDVDAMADFLASMRAQDQLDKHLEGKKYTDATNYFSTHPATAGRVADTRAQAQAYPNGGAVGRESYFKAISGITYGDSAGQGFVRGNSFIHPDIGFSFDVPSGFKITNTPAAVVAKDKSSGAAIIFDMNKTQAPTDVSTYLSQLWLQGKAVNAVERATINGMSVATTVMPGQVDGRNVDIRLLAIAFENNNFARFQIAIPHGASTSLVNALKTSSYSFRKLSASERNAARANSIKIVSAGGGDTPAKMAMRMSGSLEAREARFRVLNGLGPDDGVVAGRLYKIVVN